MKKVALLFLFFNYYSTWLVAQVNLVPNSSFEDTITCPTGINQVYNTKYWWGVGIGANLHHTCASGGIGIPSNGAGYQYARTGNAYLGTYFFKLAFPDSQRGYIEVKLIDSLKQGKSYFVSFFVSRGDKPQYAISSIGAYLSSDSIYSSNSVYLPYNPQLHNQQGHSITDSLSWTQISDTIIAQGGEKFITIGNFRPDSLSDTLHVGGTISWNDSYYYIDDVSVIEDTSTGIGIMNANQLKSIRFFPNPFSSEIIIENENTSGAEEVFLFNIYGEEVMRQKIPISQKQTRFDLSYLSNGIYFLTLQSQQGVRVEKVIKL